MSRAFGAVLILTLAGTACAARTTPLRLFPSPWPEVQALRAGTPIRVVQKSGPSVRGTMMRVNADRLIVGLRTGSRTFARDEVAEVFRFETHAPQFAKRGALIGLAAGVLVIITEKRVST